MLGGAPASQPPERTRATSQPFGWGQGCWDGLGKGGVDGHTEAWPGSPGDWLRSARHTRLTAPHSTFPRARPPPAPRCTWS